MRRAAVVSAAAIVAIAGGATWWFLLGGDEAPPAASSGGQSAAATPPAQSLVLNEIRIASHAPAIEVRNASNASQPIAGLRISGALNYTFPTNAPPLAAGAVAAVTFDGANAPAATLSIDGAALTLQNGETIIDRAAWGNASGASVPLFVGGRGMRTDGTVVARTPAASGNGGAWTALGPGRESIGRANPAPAVTAFATFDGAMFLTPEFSLSWYHVPGAVSYLVEVAADPAFSTTLWRGDVTPPTPSAPSQLTAQPQGVTAGKRSWRVTAQYADGSSATSRPRSMTVPEATSASAAGPNVKSVPITQIYQRKDTRLLHLLNPGEGGSLAWDQPDAPASHHRPYCAPAALAMVTDHFGGKVTVDRLRHEAFEPEGPGPETDLKERGFLDEETMRAATWAMSPAPTEHALSTVGAVLDWMALIKTEIDEGRPMMASTPVHMFLIVGYTLDDGNGSFAFEFMDGNAERYLVPSNADSLPSTDRAYRVRPYYDAKTDTYSGYDKYWTFAAGTVGRMDEPTVIADSDRDGVQDFDEVIRFKTDSANVDSDADGVNDKEEIRSSTWDPEEGYRVNLFQTRDHDNDKLAMELDPDSDNGGCLDGREDGDHDGIREPATGETSGFKPDDDGCIAGTFHARSDITMRQGSRLDRIRAETRASFSLDQIAGGKFRGMAAATATFEFEAKGGDPCPLYRTRPITQSWVVQLTGEIIQGQLFLDGEPDRSPDKRVVVHGCGEKDDTMFADWMQFDIFRNPITFTDGRYHLREDFPLRAGETGEMFQEIHIRQPRR